MTDYTPPPPGFSPGADTPPSAVPAPAVVAEASGSARAGSGQEGQPPLRPILVVLHLAALGAVGTVLWTTFFGLFSVGLALTFVFGIGLVLLAGLVYALFAASWLEIVRLNGLYGFEVPSLRWWPSDRPGFGGYLRALGRQAIDGRMWRGVVSIALATLLGAVVLAIFQWMVWSAVTAFAPIFTTEKVVTSWGAAFPSGWAPVLGVLGVAAAVLLLWGCVALHRFLARAIVANPLRELALHEKVRTTSAQREGAVRAADLERTRIERDLHDGVQPRLVSVGMTLGMARQKIDTDPEAAKALVEEAHTSTKSAITELRQLARGIHASVLDDRGLDAALSALAGRSHIPVHLDVRLPESARQDGTAQICRDAEAAVYFVIAEALTNAAKHSRASECRVVVRVRDGGLLWARVEDNGVGGAQVIPGGGLDGISNRVIAAGGTVRLDSPAGGPTSVEVSIPCVL